MADAKQKTKPKPKAKQPSAKPRSSSRSDYEKLKASQAAISRKRSAEGREIGPLPKVVNPRRKRRGATDPEFFNKTYFPNRFFLGFGQHHREAMRVMSECTTDGGLFALAMQRGGGKTQLAECEVIRAIVYGLRRYVLFIGATEKLANKGIARIFREFETNDLLLEDFPEVCYPIRALDRIIQRSRGQTLKGEPTRMEIQEGSLILPTVPKSKCSGSAIQAFGMTGAFKGLNLLGPDGTPFRPDLVVIDDAQTRESAGSMLQTEYRERLILDDILGLAGPTVEIAAAFLCTPIFPNDLSERFCDRQKKPEWNGVKTKMIVEFPKNLKLWEEYADVRSTGFRAGDKGKAGNEFYLANREAMDEGCVLAWPDRRKKKDISAIQTAMNLYLTNPRGFASEYQCEPEENTADAAPIELNADAVAEKLNHIPRGVVPRPCTRLTSMIDVHGKLLFFAVCAWDEKFGGGVIDYGTWPPQDRSYFSLADASPTLDDRYPNIPEDSQIFAGLRDLFDAILGRSYERDGTGESLKVDRCLVDSGWKPDPVFQASRQSPHSAIILPSKGYAVTKAGRPMAEWPVRPGERVGWNWRVGSGTGGGRGKAVLFEPNAWKTFVAERLLTPPAAAGCLQLFGEKVYTHQLFAAHATAEYAREDAGRGRKFNEWKPKPGKPDNHWWDTIVGCAVAASVSGLVWSPSGSQEPKKKRVKLDPEEMYAQANDRA